jgi:hypothetical protein
MSVPIRVLLIDDEKMGLSYLSLKSGVKQSAMLMNLE